MNKLEEFLSVGPFGGLDMTTSPYYVAPANFPDGENFVPNRSYGGYITVQGRVNALIANLPSAPNGIYCLHRAGLPDVYLFACDQGGQGRIYQAQIGGTPTQLTLPITLTAGQPSFFAAGSGPTVGWVFFTNGVDTPLKIDASMNVTRWGIVAPAAAPTAAAGGAGNLIGAYAWCVTFGTANQESSQGVISSVLSLTSQQASLTNIPVSTDAQVTQRNIYRIGGALGQWRLVGTINDNTTTTFTDNLADANVTGQSLTIFRDPPPAFKAITAHQGRIWGIATSADPNLLGWSNYNEPWGFNLNTHTAQAGESHFDNAGLNLVSIGNVLLCWTKRQMFGVWGSTDVDFQIYKLVDIGLIAQKSVAAAFGVAYWESEQGVYYYNGGAFDPIANNLSDGNYQQSNIKGFMDSLNTNDRAAAVGFIYDRMYHISFPTQNKTYVYDLRTKGWYRIGWATSQAFFDVESAVPVVAANLQTAGEVDEWFTAETDLGNAITSYITSRVTDSNLMFATKEYEKAILEAPLQSGATATMTIIANPGTGATNFSQPIDLSQGSNKHQFSIPQSLVGFEVQIQVSVTSSQRVTIERFAVYGNVKRAFIEQG